MDNRHEATDNSVGQTSYSEYAQDAALAEDVSDSKRYHTQTSLPQQPRAPNQSTNDLDDQSGAKSYRKSTVDAIDNLADMTYVLDPVGQILYASQAVERLFDHSVEDVVGHNIMEFIHHHDVQDFVSAFNDAIMLRTNLLHYHRFRRRRGDFIVLEVTGRALYDRLMHARDFDGNIVPACRCFILSARGYPTRSMSAFDQFLEIKLENERIKAELRELGETDVIWPVTEHDDHTPSANIFDLGYTMGETDTPHTTKGRGEVNIRAQDLTSEIRSARFEEGLQNSAAQMQHLPSRKGASIDSNMSSERSYSNGDNRISEDGATLPSSRSRTTSSKVSGSSTSQDVSSELPPDHLMLSRKKMRKSRADGEERTCSDCGTTDSPEWRKGPQGPKTLCNACGLRYSKKQKKTEIVQQLQLQHLQRPFQHNEDMTPPLATGGHLTPLTAENGFRNMGSQHWPFEPYSAQNKQEDSPMDHVQYWPLT